MGLGMGGCWGAGVVGGGMCSSGGDFWLMRDGDDVLRFCLLLYLCYVGEMYSETWSSEVVKVSADCPSDIGMKGSLSIGVAV
jgi:hypothetical protein